MTEPTQETPSAAPASADASAQQAAAAAPASGGQGRNNNADGAQRNRGPRNDRGPRPERSERHDGGGGKPMLNSAMADALRAATQGNAALEPRQAPEQAPKAAPAARAPVDRPAAKRFDKPRSNRPGNSERGERAGDRTGGGAGRGPRRDAAPAAPKAPPRPRHPMVEKLAGMYPALFGDQPLPLKRGIFQDLMAAHPDAFEKAELKVALGLHTRSTRYLNAVAMGQPRHDLQGNVVEAMAPEHVFHALVEAFRRRKPRDGEDLQLKLRRRMGMAYIASNLSRDAFLERVQVKDEATQGLLNAALQEVAEFDAKAEALATAHAASGKGIAEFADMYGMHPAAVERHLQRAAQVKDIAAAPAPTPAVPASPESAPAASPDAAAQDTPEAE